MPAPLKGTTSSPSRSVVSAASKIQVKESVPKHTTKNSKDDGKLSKAEQLKQKREEAKKRKQQEKETQLFENARNKQKDKQKKGGFAKNEICVLVEKNLSESDIGIELTTSLVSEEYKVLIGHDISKVLPNCIRFTRRDHVLGGATADGDHVEHFDIIAILFSKPKKFLDMLLYEEPARMTPNVGCPHDEYPKLTAWVKEIRALIMLQKHQTKLNFASTECVEETRIVLILHGVEVELRRLWNKQSRQRRESGPSIIATEEELYDAITYLLIEHRIECELSKDIEDTTDFLLRMTRQLSEKCYFEEPTELDCVKKIKLNNDCDHEPLHRAHEVWRRQLKQIPGVSDNISAHLVKYFPTKRHLHNYYEDETLTESQKRTLLTYCCDAKGTAKVKISDSIYRLMTTRNPKELI